MENPRVLLEAARFRVVEQAIPRPAGTLVRQFVVHPGAVVVVPRTDDGRVCLIRNHRTAVGKTLVELPAGTREPDEPPEVTARRELAEETGYQAATITPLPPFFMSPGILNERMHPFLATGLAEGPPAREPGEEIENLLVPWNEAIEMIRSGEIEDAKTVAALLYCHTFGAR